MSIASLTFAVKHFIELKKDAKKKLANIAQENAEKLRERFLFIDFVSCSFSATKQIQK